MSTPPYPILDSIHGINEEKGPLVRQQTPAARLARIFTHAAQELWDLCGDTDPAEMRTQALAIAKRIVVATSTFPE